jgi:ABC-type iron transport system FetAB ATPase subunit
MGEITLKSAYQGIVTIGNSTLECHVLDNRERVFTSKDFLHAFGLRFEPKEERRMARIFLEKIRFVSILNDKVIYNNLNNPIKFKKGNLTANGYSADLLPEVCNAILALSENKMLPVNMELKEVAKQSRKLLKSLASVGLIALIDEATGYQEYRDKHALQDILDKYLDKKYSVWAKRFPDDFYKEMFRLKDWEWKGMEINRPSVVGTYTKNIVYSRLAPGLLKELETRNPLTETGKRKVKHHQWLTIDVGHPALAEHLAAIIAIMKISNNWEQFERRLTKVYPVLGEQLYFDIDVDEEE